MNNLAQKNTDFSDVKPFDTPTDRIIDTPNSRLISAERLYGLDPGCFDTNRLELMDETVIWLEIYGHGGIIQQLSHPNWRGEELHQKITEQIFAIEFLTYHFCKKAGIEVAEPLSYRHVQPGPEFRKWQNFYHRHFREVLSSEEFAELQEIRKVGGDISKFLPEGTWRD